MATFAKPNQSHVYDGMERIRSLDWWDKKMHYKILSAESVENCWVKQNTLLSLSVQSVAGSHGWGWHPAGAGSTSRNQHSAVWHASDCPIYLFWIITQI